MVLALAGPASSEGYGDPAIVQDGAAEVAEPGAPFTVSFSSNVECAWSSSFNGQAGATEVGFDYSATFTAPTEPGTYEGTVVCRFSNAGPFRPVAYSADATYAAGRDQVSTQTFTVVVDGDAANGGDDDTAGAGDNNNEGALADTGGSNWQLLAVGAGLLVVGGGVAVAARRRKS
ncbi:LPXTG cell wall anchor domain-containing protein [Aeromicrobium senzhongii]|uniref:LPXTG cell wall anchor domain-containing protein n=1 Tax=Aeromicrobium senzhongii TaxID=2663859 RepID=A0ABX6SV28_9ACTN|nr:LPXTG cell wall anchor domain-containing protein [Aeromicrobium senzhongii]QNL94299.1 LPXTG cell wall anchor domain-containing protein [Aeromicrobium senzhongii]